MLTETQERYLETIPEDKITVIKPWDPRCVAVANQIIKAIKAAEPDLEILYTGASALGVPGVNDLDFSVLCPRDDFEKHLPNLEKVLGKPQKIGKENVRWEGLNFEGYEVDVHMTDPKSPDLKEHMRLFEILKNDPERLREYTKLKESSNGIPYREYQRRKYEFYNRVLEIK